LFKQLLEKKEGLFRMYMMGKRVDYAARSVITPDPLIGVEEIGIPLNFATKLTFPTPVTPWNLDQLRQAVINGSQQYPGAEFIETEDGKKIVLKSLPVEERTALASELAVSQLTRKRICGNKIVHR
jgi:DNA-directed RNA polymerase I subunit RPA1